MNQAHSAVLQFRLLDTCRATALLRVTYRSLGWGACTTPVAITGDCQMSSYPSKLGVLHPKASGLVPFVTEAAK